MESERIKLANKYRVGTCLETLCLNYIAANLPAYTFQHQLNIICVRSNEAAGPFDGLPSKFLDKIYEEYEKMLGDVPIPLEIVQVFMTNNARTMKICKFNDSKHGGGLFVHLKYKCHKNLRRLSLLDCILNDLVLHDLLESMEGLEELDLSGTKINNSTLAIVAMNMKNLSVLKLNSTDVTEKGLKYLCDHKLPELKVLEMKNNVNIGPKIMERILLTYPDLESLQHHNATESMDIAKIKKLRSMGLYLVSNQEAESYNSYLNHSNDLNHLSVHHRLLLFSEFHFNIVSTTFFRPLNPLHSVTKLTLNCVSIHIDEIFSMFPNVNDLHFRDCCLYWRDLQNISVKNIKNFYVRNCFVQHTLCFTFMNDVFYSDNIEQFSLLDFTNLDVNAIIAPINKPTHFQCLVTDCIHDKYLQKIITGNANLKSIVMIHCSPKFSRDDVQILKLNEYFRKIIRGYKESNYHLSILNNDDVLRSAVECYRSFIWTRDEID